MTSKRICPFLKTNMTEENISQEFRRKSLDKDELIEDELMN